MFFIGIDVHKKQSQICILTEQGELRLEIRVLTMRADLSDVLGSYLRPATYEIIFQSAGILSTTAVMPVVLSSS